jgi:hypothetical protein
VSSADVVATLAGFVAAYSILGAVDAVLMWRSARRDLSDLDHGSGEPVVVPGLVY